MLRIISKIECMCFRKLMNGKIDSFCIFGVRLKSYYTALGLDPSASPQDIKSAYYKLSQKFHPDKNDGSPESTSKFREIAEAYEVLSHPEKKQSYDKHVNPNYYYHGFRKNDYPYGSGFAQRPFNPRTGRTKYYNYDEHFKQHYEKYYREKQAEQEQFRRSWEANQRAYNDNWERYNYRPDSSEPIRFRILFRKLAFVYVFIFWGVFLFFISIYDISQEQSPSPVYYKTKKDSTEIDK